MRVNGEDLQVDDGLTVRQLLERADPLYRFGLVELNAELLPARSYDRVLVDGDRLEVILPAFGG